MATALQAHDLVNSISVHNRGKLSCPPGGHGPTPGPGTRGLASRALARFQPLLTCSNRELVRLCAVIWRTVPLAPPPPPPQTPAQQGRSRGQRWRHSCVRVCRNTPSEGLFLCTGMSLSMCVSSFLNRRVDAREPLGLSSRAATHAGMCH